MSISVKVDVSKALKDLDSAKLKNALRTAMVQTSVKAQQEWASTAPVLTGNLRRSSQVKNSTYDGFEIWGAHYWEYVNFGHGNYAGQPFATQIGENIPKNFEEYFNGAYK